MWLAEQSAPVKRQVALKIIKAGRYDESALLRFNVERQTLAIMDHPAIAKVFDAGSTAEGQPYFVMEYVPGLPISDYCDRKHLSVQERLALFITVCEGVQHAHQKAIMHRDLKPSNILVVEVDGKPMPRIIDFGIAKAISQQAEDETMVTRAGGMVGTLGYMSPEQADPTVLDVDTRTDVYSLGVVLYELLTGVLPFDARQWRTNPYHVMLRRLHEEDPPSPSTRLSGDSTSTTTAQCRNTDPRQLESLLRGDLDWIALKAFGKRPRPPVWHPFGTGRRCRPLSAERACSGAPGKHGIPDEKVRSAPQIWSGGGNCHGAAADRIRGDANDPIAADYARARSRRSRHGLYDRHVQGVEPERSTRQRHPGTRDFG